MVTDSIADLIVRLKNAQAAGLPATTVPYSDFKWAIVEELKRTGWVKAIAKKGKKIKKTIEIDLLYGADGRPKIRMAKRISKPGTRVYRGVAEIHAVRQGYGVGLYSTPRGVLSDKAAREKKVGGEFLFTLH